jgi:malonate-semialdehyde dehydrogenase (acetylating)/methylmalonate-semialdehyde dehydrogenase
MPDAKIDAAIPSCISSFFGNTGQRCLSGGVLVTVGDAYDKFVDKFVRMASRLRLGYGLDERTEMGPLVTMRAKERVIRYIEKGLEEGAKLLLDGRNAKVEKHPNGYFLGPTVFDDVSSDMTIAREEIFGPVCPIIRADSLDEVIEWVNEKTIYGNAASIFTSSGSTARKFRREVKAGNIGVNIGIPAPMAFFPFGGWKQSFFGVLHGQIDCVDFFTDKKIVVERWW